MSDLRQELIEAGARALMETQEGDHRDAMVWEAVHEESEAALDAFLDVLAETSWRNFPRVDALINDLRAGGQE